MSLSAAERQQFTDLLQQMDTAVGASSIAQFVQDHNLSWDHLQANHKRLASFLGMLDSNQVGERQNAGRLAAKYIKDRGLSFDDVIGPAAAEAAWEPWPEPAAAWEPEPEPEAMWEPEPDVEPEATWEPEPEPPVENEAPDVKGAPPAKAVPEWDDLTTTQQVIFGIFMLAVAIPTVLAAKWVFALAFSQPQRLLLACIVIAVVAVRWVVKRARG